MSSILLNSMSNGVNYGSKKKKAKKKAEAEAKKRRLAEEKKRAEAAVANLNQLESEKQKVTAELIESQTQEAALKAEIQIKVQAHKDAFSDVGAVVPTTFTVVDDKVKIQQTQEGFEAGLEAALTAGIEIGVNGLVGEAKAKAESELRAKITKTYSESFIVEDKASNSFTYQDGKCVSCHDATTTGFEGETLAEYNSSVAAATKGIAKLESLTLDQVVADQKTALAKLDKIQNAQIEEVKNLGNAIVDAIKVVAGYKIPPTATGSTSNNFDDYEKDKHGGITVNGTYIPDLRGLSG